MSQPVRFLFDTRFDAPRNGKSAPARESAEDAAARVMHSEYEQRIADVRAEAHALGVAEGEKAAALSATARAAGATERLVKAVEILSRQLGEAQGNARREAVEVALAAAEKLSSGLVTRQPEHALRALFEDCLSHAPEVPRFTIRVAADVADDVERALRDAAKTHAYAGDIAIVSDDTYAAGDGRIEWADGGAEQNRDRIAREVDAAVTAWLAKTARADGNTDNDTETGGAGDE